MASRYEQGVNDAARLLVVDDDADIRGLLRDVLVRAGYVVDEATDGRAALRRLFESPPALVILDVAMPGLDGYETLERIRDVSDVPVLMLTARAEELEKVRGLSGGADDYVAKPFGHQELVARVQALLRRAPASTVRETYADAFLQIDYGATPRHGRGRGGAPHAARVQAALGVRRSPEPGALARPAARPRLERRLRRLGRPGEAVRRLPAAEARARPRRRRRPSRRCAGSATATAGPAEPAATRRARPPRRRASPRPTGRPAARRATTVPSPTTLLTSMRPPCASTISLEM